METVEILVQTGLDMALLLATRDEDTFHDEEPVGSESGADEVTCKQGSEISDEVFEIEY